MAVTWGAASAKKIGEPLPDCSLCRKPNLKEKREEWGCDAPAPEVVFSVTCSACAGNGCPTPEEPVDVGAPRCLDGQMSFYRCPTQVLDADENGTDVMRVLESVRDLEAWNVLPASGGMLDQCCVFVEALRVVMHERAVWEKRERKHREHVVRQGGEGEAI